MSVRDAADRLVLITSFTMSAAPLLSTDDHELYVNDVAMQETLSDDYKRFGCRPPLQTVLVLSIGPILYNLTSSFQDILDFLMIRISNGDYGLTLIGFANFFRYLCNGLASFPGQSCIVKVSSLLGEGRKDEAAQVVTDLFRFAFCICFIAPFCIYFCGKPIMKFMACKDEYLDECLRYGLPICFGMFTTSIFRISCGTILGEGRSLLFAMMHLAILILNCCVFDPLFLIAFKWPLWTVGVSYVLAMGIPGFILMLLIFSGKFTVKPKWSMFLNKFSKETWPGIKLSFSNLLTFLTGAFPSMIFYRYLYIAAENAGVYEEMTAIMPATLKFYNFIGEITMGISAGMLPAGSWAFAGKKLKRFMQLSGWAICVALIQQVIMTPIMIIKPSLLTQILSKEKETLAVCDKYMPTLFYANMLLAIHETGTNMLLAMNRPWFAMVPMATRGILFALGSYLFYLWNKNDPKYVLFVFPAIDISMFLSICIVLPPILCKLYKGNVPSVDNNTTGASSSVLDDQESDEKK